MSSACPLFLCNRCFILVDIITLGVKIVVDYPYLGRPFTTKTTSRRSPPTKQRKRRKQPSISQFRKNNISRYFQFSSFTPSCFTSFHFPSQLYECRHYIINFPSDHELRYEFRTTALHSLGVIHQCF
jgi:hypothetical protein